MLAVGAMTVLLSCSGGGGADKAPTGPATPALVLTTVSVSLSTTSVQVGQTAVASATATDQNGSAIATGAVNWSSSTATVATVQSNGTITAVAPGQATITATAGGKSGQATVTVTPAPVTVVSVSPSTFSLAVGASQVLTATPKDAFGNTVSGKTVTWTASDINALSGVINGNSLTTTARSTGTVTVYATVDGVVGTATVTITPAPVAAVASVSMSASSLTLDVNQVTTVSAVPRDVSGNVVQGKTVTWTTSDGSVVGGTVNGNSADLQGVAAGSATVTATVDGKAGQIAVLVRSTSPTAVATVAVSPSVGFVAVGGTLSLVATMKDGLGNTLTGRTVAWTVTGLGVIANATATGALATITGLTAGTITVTATSEGKVGSASVTVLAASGGSVSLTCTGVNGGVIYAQDGQFLGKLSSQFDNQSILNQYGNYGSQFSSTSMYNQFSNYGSQFAAYSAYNQFSNSPPILYLNNRSVAYVTKNPFRTPSVDPSALRSCTFF